MPPSIAPRSPELGSPEEDGVDKGRLSPLLLCSFIVLLLGVAIAPRWMHEPFNQTSSTAPLDRWSLSRSDASKLKEVASSNKCCSQLKFLSCRAGQFDHAAASLNFCRQPNSYQNSVEAPTKLARLQVFTEPSR